MSFEIDKVSLLVGVPGAATLASIERAISNDGFTLGMAVAGETITVADWLSKGAPGAPSSFSDPADHLVAGLTATLADRRRLDIRPSPRRAVGPDLIALFLGARERFGTINHVWLRVHRKDAIRRVTDESIAHLDLEAPISSEETALLDAITRSLNVG